MEKITIYTQGACGYCKTVKDALNKENIEFEEKLINEHPNDWSKINSLTNMPTTPTIHYKENYFVAGRDFPSPEVLINILRNFVSTGEVNSFKVFIFSKTLNKLTSLFPLKFLSILTKTSGFGKSLPATK